MKGLELSEKYYEAVRPELVEKFPEVFSRIAAGLAGEGSECFGYDDEISRDHDFGPSFCLWLSDEDYEKYGRALAAWYASLPGEFLGFPARRAEKHGGGMEAAMTGERTLTLTCRLPRLSARGIKETNDETAAD